MHFVVKFTEKSASSPIDILTRCYELDSNREDDKQDVFYRAALADRQGQRIHPKPNAPGAQTALVIGVPNQHL